VRGRKTGNTKKKDSKDQSENDKEGKATLLGVKIGREEERKGITCRFRW